jgi:hypothetical protein
VLLQKFRLKHDVFQGSAAARIEVHIQQDDDRLSQIASPSSLMAEGDHVIDADRPLRASAGGTRS